MVARGITTSMYLIPILTLALLLAPLQVVQAQHAPGQNDLDQDPITVNEGSADLEESETERQIDEITAMVRQLTWQNNQLYEASVNDDKNAQDTMERNNEAILRLMEQLDVLSPPIVVVEISESTKTKMNAIMDKLMESDLPLLEMGIDPSTGSLGLMVDIDRAGPDTEKKIREIATSVNLTITYDTDDASFQGACNQST